MKNKNIIILIMALNIFFVKFLSAETVAYWRFNEGAGQIAYTEDDSNQIFMRFGTSDSLWANPQWASLGVSGKCIRFINDQGPSEGDRDFLLPDAGTEPNAIKSLRLSTFTVEAWIKLESIPQSGFDSNNPYTILHLSDGSDNSLSNYLLRITRKDENNAQFGAIWYDENKVLKAFTHPTDIKVGDWYHVAVGHNSNLTTNNTILWVNGVSYTQNTVNHPYAEQESPKFCIGAMYNNAATDFRSRSFDGWIDEVRISSEFLSVDQLLLPYNHDGPMTHYLIPDLTKNFYVEIYDMRIFLDSWLESTNIE